MELYKHQRDFLEKHWSDTSHGLFWQMGVGKTPVTLLNMLMLYKAGLIQGGLIIAPNGVHGNWAMEVNRHFPGTRIVVYSSRRGMAQHHAIKDLFSNTTGLRLLAMNVEALSYPASEAVKLAYDFLRAVKCALVVDESTVIKNPKANRTKVALKLSQFAPYRRALTGSPIADSPFDAWSQLEFLKRGATGLNYFQFQKEHGIYEQVFLGPRSFSKVVGYRRLPQLKKQMESLGTFVAKADCLDLPPKIYMTRDVEMSDEQKRLYAIVKADISVAFAGGFIEPINAMAKLQHLHNIVIGFVKTDDGEIKWITDTRITDLMNLIEEIDEKVIVWCSSRPAIAKIADALKARFGPGSWVEIHGGIDPAIRQANVSAFQDKPQVRVFLGNQRVGGQGYTLTASSYVVYFRNSYSLETRLHSEDRPHRIGQTKAVTIIDMIVRGTVDQYNVEALKNKQDVAAEVVTFLKRVTTDKP